jgi:hypothetical protein
MTQKYFWVGHLRLYRRKMGSEEIEEGSKSLRFVAEEKVVQFFHESGYESM